MGSRSATGRWPDRAPPARRTGAGAQAVRWMIEELRVSLFAQMLGTSGPVSEQRIRAAVDRLTCG